MVGGVCFFNGRMEGWTLNANFSPEDGRNGAVWKLLQLLHDLQRPPDFCT